MKFRSIAAVVFGVLFMFVANAVAQEDDRGKQEFSAQGTGDFTKNSTTNRIIQHSTNSGGFLLSYRYHFNSWFSADISYGRNRETQRNIAPGSTLSVQSDVNQVTAAGVANLPWRPLRLNPFVLAGTGALAFSPTQARGATVLGAGGNSKATFLYGGGVDYDFTHHFSFRAEYRGLVYGRPDFGVIAVRTGAVTHTAQPSAGFVFRF